MGSGSPICAFVALAPEVDKMGSRMSDLNISWPWLQKSTKSVPGSSISAFSCHGRQNKFLQVRFKHFLALAPEVDEIGSARSDLGIFWPWLQKSTTDDIASRSSVLSILALAPEVVADFLVKSCKKRCILLVWVSLDVSWECLGRQVLSLNHAAVRRILLVWVS